MEDPNPRELTPTRLETWNGMGEVSSVVKGIRYVKSDLREINLIEGLGTFPSAGTDVLYLTVGSKSIIVLDSYEAAVDLLSKRGVRYSSR
jgi:hypothetical protein